MTLKTLKNVHFSTADKRRFFDSIDFDNGEQTEYVDTPCWGWRKSVNKFGYGRFAWGNKRMFAHRAIFHALNIIIPGDLCVLHLCHNPCCCNPEHLYFGTMKDNVEDMMQAGRNKNGGGGGAVGESCHFSKLTEDEVKKIRYFNNYFTILPQQLADDHEVQIGTIYAIIARQTWKHIK